MDFSRLKESWGGIIIVVVIALVLFALLQKGKAATNETGGVKDLPPVDTQVFLDPKVGTK